MRRTRLVVATALIVGLLLGAAVPLGAYESRRIKAQVKTFDRWYSPSAEAWRSRGWARIWNKSDNPQIIYCTVEALNAKGKNVGLYRDRIGTYFRKGNSSRRFYYKIPNPAGSGRARKPVRARIKLCWLA